MFRTYQKGQDLDQSLSDSTSNLVKYHEVTGRQVETSNMSLIHKKLDLRSPICNDQTDHTTE